MVGAVQAGLCPKCAGKMYTQDIGTCTKCGGPTSSGAFKLCRKCSEAEKKCEHCMGPLTPPPSKHTKDKKAADDKAAKAEEKSDALELAQEHDGKTVTVPVGKDIVIRLPGNPTTGFSWKIGEVKGEAVKSQGEPAYVTRPHKPGMVGVGGTYTFKLQAVEEGKATVKLVYLRPWEKKDPHQTFTVTVQVEKKK
jgi:inhibitor of cysteine peptidase